MDRRKGPTLATHKMLSNMAVKWIVLNAFWKGILIVFAFMLALWLIASLFVQRERNGELWETGETIMPQKAIVIYNPDPFYNFDEQICKTFATTLGDYKWYVQVLTVSAARDAILSEVDLIVFCANTYNWAPDTVTKDFIKTLNLKGKYCAAITLGAGTTDRAQRILEKTITDRGGILLGSEAYWLWKPNAEPRVVTSNVHMGKLMAEEFARKINGNF